MKNKGKFVGFGWTGLSYRHFRHAITVDAEVHVGASEGRTRCWINFGLERTLWDSLSNHWLSKTIQ